MKKGEKSDNNNKQKKRKTSYSDDSDDDYVLEDDDDVESNGSEGFIDHNNPSEDEEVGFDDSEEKEGYVIGSDSDDDDDEFISSRKRKRKLKVIVRSKDSKSGGKRTRVKPQRRKKTLDSDDDDSDGDDDDEDYCVFNDEFAIEKVATGSKSSGKKTRGRSRQSSNRSTWVPKVEEEDCEFEDELVGKTTRGRQLSRVSNEVEEEEYCESEDALGGKKNRGRIQSSNRDTRVSDEDVEYCEFGDELVAKKTKGRRQLTSKRSKASDDDDEEYDLEDENDEDEEFEPDGIDFVDEEEEDLEEVEYKKAVKRRKISVKGRNRKRKTKVLKKRKRERGILGVTKPAESSDDDFVDTVSVGREKCKKTTRSRTKRVVTEWDSDSASSKSSDLEYTISEEEKESLEEAKKFCGELKTCTRSLVPVKKSQVDVEALDLQEEKPLRRLRKGKATVNDLINDSGKQVCGICLSEEGNPIVKGTLDCCSHYFCFGCIMEWSKVESRCPLCKQRFSSITRAPRSSIGIDLRTTVVQVPMRDQVYRPSEEEVRGYFDPYENVLCMECHQGGDDSLMLLCDICDSPAHTYCVGLQREVPEGNWYCEGCRISEAGSSNIQLQIPVVNRGLSGNVSISTSVSAYRTDTEGLFPPPLHFPIQQPSYSQGYRNLQSPRYHVHATSPSGAGVSTLSGRRRVHRQVHDRFSINRENQMTDYPGRTSAIPEIDLNREVVEAELCEDLIDQRSRDVLISGSISTEFDHWVQEGGSYSARLSPSRQVAGLGTSTTVTDGSELATLRSEHDMTNLLLGSEQFNHCSSVRSDDSISPHTKSYIHRESAS